MEPELVKLLKNYFGGVVEELELERPDISQEYNNPVENAIKAFENYPNIVKIKANINRTQKVLFAVLNTDDIKKDLAK